jgi:hypothetical protein
MKLRPKNPLLFAVIEEAEVPGITSIASFGHDCLPTTRSAFERLSHYKPHRPSSDKIKGKLTRGGSIALVHVGPFSWGGAQAQTARLAICRRFFLRR